MGELLREMNKLVSKAPICKLNGGTFGKLPEEDHVFKQFEKMYACEWDAPPQTLSNALGNWIARLLAKYKIRQECAPLLKFISDALTSFDRRTCQDEHLEEDEMKLLV